MHPLPQPFPRIAFSASLEIAEKCSAPDEPICLDLVQYSVASEWLLWVTSGNYSPILAIVVSRPEAANPERQRQWAYRYTTIARKLRRRIHKTPEVDPACLIAKLRPGWDRVQLAYKDLEHNSRLLPG